MKRPRSYTYELMDPREFLSRVKQALMEGGEAWTRIAEVIQLGHVEYKPIRNNPMRSGLQYQYQTAGLDLTVYYPEAQFEFVSTVVAPRTGYFDATTCHNPHIQHIKRDKNIVGNNPCRHRSYKHYEGNRPPHANGLS